MKRTCNNCVDKDSQCVGCWSWDMEDKHPGYAWND